MARIKYGPGVSPITKKHEGFVFSDGHYCPCMKIAAKSGRTRQRNQINRKLNLIQSVTNWRNLSPAQQAAWVTFATTYPQPTKRDATKFLTGYQLFIKRQQYVFLNESIESDWLIPPPSVPIPAFSYSVSVDQIDNCVEVTEPYINAFGLLPEAGDYLILKVIAMATATGQFFTPVTSIVQVNAVYIDGLFLSLSFAGSIPDCIFSVFLSSPVHQSAQINKFKTHYMGCFTSKKFIQLTDCPSAYAGQAGKVPTVNATENGLIFQTPGGGGLTCADLINCPTIIDIYDKLNILFFYITQSLFSSMPAIKFGRLYNHYAVRSAHLFAPAGWHIPSVAEFNTLATYLGGLSVAGAKMRETGTTFWTSPNTGATNSSKFSDKANGYRLDYGTYSTVKNWSYMWTTNLYSGVQYYIYNNGYATAALSQAYTPEKSGCGIRLIKDDSTFVPYLTGNDGQIYRCFKIGTQVWMCDYSVETLFRDLTPIPYVTDSPTWAALTTPARCDAYGHDYDVFV